jgi:hypothetical protein
MKFGKYPYGRLGGSTVKRDDPTVLCKPEADSDARCRQSWHIPKFGSASAQ